MADYRARWGVLIGILGKRGSGIKVREAHRYHVQILAL